MKRSKKTLFLLIHSCHFTPNNKMYQEKPHQLEEKKKKTASYEKKSFFTYYWLPVKAKTTARER